MSQKELFSTKLDDVSSIPFAREVIVSMTLSASSTTKCSWLLQIAVYEPFAMYHICRDFQKPTEQYPTTAIRGSNNLPSCTLATPDCGRHAPYRVPQLSPFADSEALVGKWWKWKGTSRSEIFSPVRLNTESVGHEPSPDTHLRPSAKTNVRIPYGSEQCPRRHYRFKCTSQGRGHLLERQPLAATGTSHLSHRISAHSTAAAAVAAAASR
ncbi:hypothetical protein J6590_037278 [Homalodisca vitripennis]|nr:hypothetical protein J6590_037278 [Homalodisca vitripennis]